MQLVGWYIGLGTIVSVSFNMRVIMIVFNTNTHIQTHTCLSIYIHKYVYVYVFCMYTYTKTHMFACIHVCVGGREYTHTTLVEDFFKPEVNISRNRKWTDFSFVQPRPIVWQQTIEKQGTEWDLKEIPFRIHV